MDSLSAVGAHLQHVAHHGQVAPHDLFVQRVLVNQLFQVQGGYTGLKRSALGQVIAFGLLGEVKSNLLFNFGGIIGLLGI